MAATTTCTKNQALFKVQTTRVDSAGKATHGQAFPQDQSNQWAPTFELVGGQAQWPPICPALSREVLPWLAESRTVAQHCAALPVWAVLPVGTVHQFRQ